MSILIRGLVLITFMFSCSVYSNDDELECFLASIKSGSSTAPAYIKGKTVFFSETSSGKAIKSYISNNNIKIIRQNPNETVLYDEVTRSYYKLGDDFITIQLKTPYHGQSIEKKFQIKSIESIKNKEEYLEDLFSYQAPKMARETYDDAVFFFDEYIKVVFNERNRDQMPTGWGLEFKGIAGRPERITFSRRTSAESQAVVEFQLNGLSVLVSTKMSPYSNPVDIQHMDLKTFENIKKEELFQFLLDTAMNSLKKNDPVGHLYIGLNDVKEKLVAVLASKDMNRFGKPHFEVNQNIIEKIRIIKGALKRADKQAAVSLVDFSLFIFKLNSDELDKLIQFFVNTSDSIFYEKIKNILSITNTTPEEFLIKLYK